MESNILNIYKTNTYINLTKNLNCALLNYWMMSSFEKTEDFIKHREYIIELIRCLHLSDYVKHFDLSFENIISGGYYNYYEKKLSINIGKIFMLKQLKIISENVFLVEYFFILFHELFHSIQYKYLIEHEEYLIAYMKKTSLTFKNNKKYTLKLH